MRISDWSSDVCSSDLSGNASGAGRYSGQAIATTPGSAYRCITKGGDQGPAVSGHHDRPGVPRYDHLRDVIRRAAMPAPGPHGQLVPAGVLPCAALAVLLALPGRAVYPARLDRGLVARRTAIAEPVPRGLSVSGVWEAAPP